MTDLTKEAVEAALAKATPGPWPFDRSTTSRVTLEGGTVHIIQRKSDTQPIVFVSGLDDDNAEGLHNARLIAMAPDLARAYLDLTEEVEVLERLRPVWANGEGYDTAPQVNAAALAQLWSMLGASNQTETVNNLKGLLNRVEAAEAERDGLRDQAVRACVLSGQDLAEGDWGPEGRNMALMIEERVRAALGAKP